MNTIKNNTKTSEPSVFKEGDIFKRGGCLYILAIVGFKNEKLLYSLINLGGGNRWDDGSPDINSVVSGMDFVGRDLTITIS